MLKFLIFLSFSLIICFGLPKIFSKNENYLIIVLTKKFFNDLSIVLRTILDILDSLFKNFIQIYELLGLISKKLVEIFKSLISTCIQFINLFKVIGLTLISFISLCKGLLKESKKITLLNNFEAILTQTKSAKNNVVRLFNVKRNDLTNNKEATLER